MSIKFKKFEPAEYVIRIKNGKIVDKGTGLSFFYNSMNTSMIVIPATAFDSGFAFDDVMTADFQRISVQGDISYVIVDFEQAAKMVNFTYADNKNEYNEVLANAKLAMSKRILNLAKIYIAKYIAGCSVRQALVCADEIADYLYNSIKDDKTIKEFGLELITISILGLNTSRETRSALEAATREEILKQQDDAIYKRRNSAIEQERIVKENELNTEIKVAEKQKEKREKEMETKRLIQEKQAELDAKKLEDDIRLEEENKKLVELQAANERIMSDAKAYDSAAQLNAMADVDSELIKALAISGMDSKSLIAQAFVEIGNKADKIGVLNVTPDLLDTLSK